MKWIAGMMLVALAGTAYADGGKLVVPGNATWQEECGSCHIAYPPQLLDKQGWQQLMSGLDKHFGTDATLEPEAQREISGFLQRYAASSGRHSASSARISDTSWFIREHREVSGSTWVNPEVRSRSNCTACHVSAERGDWSERGIRVPGGRFEDDDD
ncbi:MAG: cytochrome C [Sideroxydans sp.]|nr:cytochrome C [Sideroxydans sp.]